MTPTATTGELARLVGGTLRGSPDVVIQGVGTVHDAGPHEIAWVTDVTYFKKASVCRAAAIIGPADLPDTLGAVVIVSDVEAAIAKVLAFFEPPLWQPPAGRDGSAYIDPTAELGEGVVVGPFVTIGPRTIIGRGTVLYSGVFVGADATIGASCQLWPNVFVGDRCQIGNRVVIWPSATIGRPGFGFILRERRLQRIPQIGTVVLEDDVEVGAGACVDRAKCGATRIGVGSKIDNMVQVAHNVRIGPGCILAGQVGLAGSVRLGTGVVLAGQVGVVDGVEVGDGVRATAKAGITHSVAAGMTVASYPARDRMTTLREQAAVRRLPDLADLVRKLSLRVEALEAAANNSQAG